MTFVLTRFELVTLIVALADALAEMMMSGEHSNREAERVVVRIAELVEMLPEDETTKQEIRLQ